MSVSFKPGAVHCALAALAIATIICGIGWHEARRENQRRVDRERAFAAELAAVKDSLASSREALEASQEATVKVLEDLEQRIRGLTDAHDRLNARLDEETNGPFVIPDGEIRWLDPVGRKVWISIGEADGVKARDTFTVYKKTSSRVHDGRVKVAIGKNDRKGAIEVTRVLEAHLSEARILNEDLNHPMAKGDPICSPPWRIGAGESFSIIGKIDLDGDGQEDLEQFRKLVATTGGTIDNEVEESGTLLVNGKPPADGKTHVTARTKFIVIGGIPDIKDGDDPKTVDRIQKVLERRRELESAARDLGIRVISLRDFLTYIGYNPNRRLFGPGREVPFKLKSG